MSLLLKKQGTTILTEVPEMFGAETILMNRCANEKQMDFTLSKQQQMVQKMYKEFAENEVKPLAKKVDAEEDWNRRWQRYCLC